MKSLTGRERKQKPAGEGGKERSMGFVEEGRQLIQDFVTPEIRSIDARLNALEKRVESMDVKFEKRFDSIDKRFDSIENKIERNHDQVLETLHRMENYSHVLERLARLESKNAA
jgi:tetrahydromethanopterin S-methyltransferase subunit G